MILMLQELQQQIYAATFGVKTVVHVSQLVRRSSSALVNAGIVAHTAKTEYHLASTSGTGQLAILSSTTQKTVTKAA